MSKSWKSFVEPCLAGQVHADEIDRFVDEWHECDFGCSLAEYLGFSDDEYAEWVEHAESLSALIAELAASLVGRTILSVMNTTRTGLSVLLADSAIKASLSVILLAHKHHVPFQETRTFVDDQLALAAQGPALRHG